jgi:hypothetical protein
VTTIAVSRPLLMMVSDTSISQGSARLPDCPKMWRNKDCIVGIAGCVLSGEKFAEWMCTKKGTRPKGAYDAIVLYRDGRISWFMEGHKEQFIKADYFAIGSGASYAKGALETMEAMGLVLDPRIAVRASCKHDIMSKEPIRTLRWLPSDGR